MLKGSEKTIQNKIKLIISKKQNNNYFDPDSNYKAYTLTMEGP